MSFARRREWLQNRWNRWPKPGGEREGGKERSGGRTFFRLRVEFEVYLLS